MGAGDVARKDVRNRLGVGLNREMRFIGGLPLTENAFRGLGRDGWVARHHHHGHGGGPAVWRLRPKPIHDLLHLNHRLDVVGTGPIQGGRIAFWGPAMGPAEYSRHDGFGKGHGQQKIERVIDLKIWRHKG